MSLEATRALKGFFGLWSPVPLSVMAPLAPKPLIRPILLQFKASDMPIELKNAERSLYVLCCCLFLMTSLRKLRVILMLRESTIQAKQST